MASNDPGDGDKIDLNGQNGGNGSNNGRPHRSPSDVPDIYINGNTLSFDDSCIGCTIVLYQDNQVVFTATVSDSAEIQLPTTLSGNLTLEITVGSIVFIGEFQL